MKSAEPEAPKPTYKNVLKLTRLTSKAKTKALAALEIYLRALTAEEELHRQFMLEEVAFVADNQDEHDDVAASLLDMVAWTSETIETLEEYETEYP